MHPGCALLTQRGHNNAGDPAKEAEAADIIAVIGFDPKYVGPIRFGMHSKSALLSSYCRIFASFQNMRVSLSYLRASSSGAELCPIAPLTPDPRHFSAQPGGNCRAMDPHGRARA
jgi:hypothetical protein